MKSKTGIFADGENLVVFFKGDDRAEFAYTFEDALITKIEVKMGNDLDESVEFIGSGKRVWMPMQRPNTTFELEGVCQADKTRMESSDIGGLIPRLDLFKHVSVSDLFIAINKKLNKRKK